MMQEACQNFTGMNAKIKRKCQLVTNRTNINESKTKNKCKITKQGMSAWVYLSMYLLS